METTSWTAEDAADDGFATTVVWNLTRSVDPDRDDELRDELEACGVRILSSRDL